MKNKRILVAGASGLVGGALVNELLKAGNKVWALARFRDASRRAALENLGVKTFAVDVGTSDFAEIPGLPREYDVVFHEIALMMEAEDNRPYTWQVNAYSAPRLVEFCRGSGQFVIASTGGLYPAGDQARKEGDALGAAGTYGATKIAMEALATYVCHQHKLPLALLRYHWPYSEMGGMVASVARQIANGETFEINRINRSILHPMWIGDTIRMTIAAADRASTEPYVVNMAGEEPIEREELIHKVAAALGRKAVTVDKDFPKISHIADLTKMHADFGKCEVGLDDGIRRVVTHFGNPTLT